MSPSVNSAQSALDKLKRVVYNVGKHIHLPSQPTDDCWCCGCSLPSYAREEHHVVPRAYGGTDGPTVSLCLVCHTRAHKHAMRVNSVLSLPSTSTYERNLLYLAAVIALSRTSIADTSGRLVKYSGSWNPQTYSQVQKLKHALGFTNQNDLIVYAIESLYDRYIVD